MPTCRTTRVPDDGELAGALERTRALLVHRDRLVRERCAAELREMAREFPSSVALALRLAAERLEEG